MNLGNQCSFRLQDKLQKMTITILHHYLTKSQTDSISRPSNLYSDGKLQDVGPHFHLILGLAQSPRANYHCEVHYLPLYAWVSRPGKVLGPKHV